MQNIKKIYERNIIEKGKMQTNPIFVLQIISYIIGKTRRQGKLEPENFLSKLFLKL